ncbi:MAG: hypothetical protein IKH77_01630 [Clostridia bacterium]|nr:hypothetical protein [Clostridia bacterium]
MFHPELITYLGHEGTVGFFSYFGVQIHVCFNRASTSVGVSQPLPDEVLGGLLAWFGLDAHRHMRTVRYQDNSRLYSQAAA